jgi:hypothetical protein
MTKLIRIRKMSPTVINEKRCTDSASGRRKSIASQCARTDIRKESVAIRVVETWNRLPGRVKPESFKKELKKKLLWLRLRKNGWRNVRKPRR